MKKIDLFRAGAQTAMSGKRIEFSEADVAAIASAYDPAVHEAPLVVGHPKGDRDPAYGWVTGLTAEGGKLSATAGQVNPDFAELVEAGAFKKVSASFYEPGSAANPTPGVYHLRHIGFLGAQPPAVKGLAPIEFAAGEEGVETIEFGEFDASWMGDVAASIRGMRDWILGKFGQEEADKALPGYQTSWLERQATRAAVGADSDGPAAFAEPTGTDIAVPVTPAVEEPEPDAAEAAEIDPVAEPEPEPEPEAAMQPDAAATAFAEREASLAAAQAELAQQRAEFAERDAATRRAAATAEVDGLVREGKLAPGYRDQVASFLERLDDDGAVSFAEGGEAETPRAFFLRLARAGKPVINFGEATPAKVATTAEQPVGDEVARRARRITEIREAVVREGRSVSFAEASAKLDQEGNDF